MKIALTIIGAVTACVCNASAPSIKESSVSMTQDSATRMVTISYELQDEPAVVTLDIQTNGVSIGCANVTHLSGAVNKLVQTGPQTILWAADKSWPDHRITDNSVTAVVKAWATNAPPDFLVVDLDLDNTMWFYEAAEQIPGGITNDMYKTNLLVMRKVPAKNVTFRMGASKNEDGAAAYAVPHLVSFSDDYYIGVYTVTQKQYEEVMGDNPSSAKGFPDSPKCPVEQVAFSKLRGGRSDAGYNWPNDKHNVKSDSFLGKLRSHVSNAVEFDLPTDAQWEYACRAGTSTAFANGSDTDGTSMGWYNNAFSRPHEVGCKDPNAWNIYDMHGNIFEYCIDWYADNPSGGAEERDPVGPSGNADSNVVTRGGRWTNAYGFCRSCYRQGGYVGASANISFRVAAPACIR